MLMLRIIYQDDFLVVIDKPPGLAVHPPERPMPGAQTVHDHVVKRLRNQIGKYVYPVHRLDAATSGIMVVALSSQIASKLQDQFKNKTVEKKYFAVTRGWLDAEFEMNDLDRGETHFMTYHRFVIDRPVGQHSSARYSIVLAMPKTGKFHQIRRHLKSRSNPIVGDTVYGDGAHNRFWRELIPGGGLYLKAYSLSFEHPENKQRLSFRSKWGRRWLAMFDQAGFCPLLI